jgi:hypothetical protein
LVGDSYNGTDGTVANDVVVKLVTNPRFGGEFDVVLD